jgi:hypothetical protein
MMRHEAYFVIGIPVFEYSTRALYSNVIVIVSTVLLIMYSSTVRKKFMRILYSRSTVLSTNRVLGVQK